MKFLKSKIFWLLVTIAAGVGIYFGVENNWWINPVEEPKVETVETPVVETDSVEIIEIIIVDVDPNDGVERLMIADPNAEDSVVELGGISYILSVEQ